MTVLIVSLGFLACATFGAWAYYKGFERGYRLGESHGRETERARLTRNPVTSLNTQDLDKLARSLGPHVTRTDVLEMWM